MKAKQLIHAAAAVLALSPLAAFAGGGDLGAKEWFASQKSARTVQEVRAEAKAVQHHGERHPVETVVAAESTLSRAEVKQDLAMHGASMIGA